MKKTKRIWKYAAVVFLIFTVISIFFYLRFSGSRDILRSEEISTGVQNRLLTYDETREILFMGSYQNKLAAYQNNKLIWEFEGNGPFCSLKICEENGSLYAANEDNHIYVLDLEDGSVEKDINFGKRMNDMDISRDVVAPLFLRIVMRLHMRTGLPIRLDMELQRMNYIAKVSAR